MLFERLVRCERTRAVLAIEVRCDVDLPGPRTRVSVVSRLSVSAFTAHGVVQVAAKASVRPCGFAAIVANAHASTQVCCSGSRALNLIYDLAHASANNC